ncbi:MAG: sulfatase [Candidatus Eisenbacteria bacterium]
MGKRPYLRAVLAGALALAIGCGGGGDSGGGEKAAGLPAGPHPIVLIDIGTLRADHLGCYGYDRATSPNIDALAGESVLFEWAFSQAPMTGPSQASILTGLYPTSHGMAEEGTRLTDEATTLAEALAAHGYTTAAFVDGGYLSEGFGLNQGFGVYDNSQGGGLEAIGPKAIEWLRGHASENFLLLVHTYDVHTPYAPPAPHRDLFTNGITPTAGFEPTAEAMEAVRAGDAPALGENDLAYAKALYDGEIHYVDEWVGSFLGVIRELGLDGRATIVLFSDHGEEFGEHGSVLHEKLHAAVTRVPLVIRMPGGAEAGRISQVVEMIDLMPTLLELSGAPTPGVIQGESLVPLVQGQGQPPYVAFSESPHFGGQHAMAMGGYHMIYREEGGEAEFYALGRDPLEQKNLAGTEGERLEVMKRQAGVWREKVSAFSFAGGEAAAVGEETLEQLKSLGYVQ